MRFLLDENVPKGLLRLLTGFGHDAVFSPKRLSNGAVFASAVSVQRTLITHDRDFAEQPPPLASHPGIVLLRIFPKEFGQLTVALRRLLADKPSSELFTDRLFLVFPDRHEEFPFRAKEMSL